MLNLRCPSSAGQARPVPTRTFANIDELPERDRAEIWTDPAFHGQGIASGLLSAALEHAAKSSGGPVRLSVWKWRTGAIALYERSVVGVTTATQ
ncbi:GNAT family N-acetyltransferase [Actinomadura sp. NPDC048394]|uniref:GNAT family N-acetyltransferase n=1 Tax=Actinomadura sp. NPDC048394 TaxID=3158223 RepID=UPI0033E132E8